ncbi:SPX domain-containing membrane protein [Seminavis robusta]|uniref:SPX domain-containing membrane protein n=1 Tax=Seminavis robusta TaxID=568900 RepID=A0A9N8HUC6_9STRA|nr:SPX domain-containing membrane protein [Seminavis robusta]|eukprot:Sro1638_g287740.1 SPX domain-containing membrane protein (874) ;mRNA; r:7188-9976
MVGFGKSIVLAGRDCWKQAYLDYDGLKEIVEEIEICLTERKSARFGDNLTPSAAGNNENESDPTIELKQRFFLELTREIEKISLFTLQQQGKLADAIGALRFEESSVNLFDTTNLLQQGDDDSVARSNDQLDHYAVQGVQLLHLLKFICINSIGIRKILKKYNKAFSKFDEPQHYHFAGDHLQQLAFSPSICAIESSLQYALAECYQHGQTTAVTDHMILLRINRFHCVMGCCQTLRRNAEILQRPFWDFMSRKSMIVAGADLGGMGDSGKKALKWLIRLHPDQLLSMSGEQLDRLWSQWSGGPTVVKKVTEDYRSAMIPQLILDTIREGYLEDERSEKGDIPTSISIADGKKSMWGGVNTASLTLNLFSTLLYTVNYYIIAPTANHYAIKLGADGAYGSTLIGASSFSAIFAAFFYSMWYTKSTFRSSLMFSAICPLVGNFFYALAISYRSLPMAISGRILCGFGSAEVVNRQLISACVDFEGMTKASAFFVAAGAIGMSFGPLLAAVLEMTTGSDSDIDIPLPFVPAGGIIFNHITSPGYTMCLLWLLQLLALQVLFQEPQRINSEGGGSERTAGSDNFGLTDDSGDSVSDEESPMLKNSESGYGSVPMAKGMDKMEAKRFSLMEEAAITTSLIFQNPGLPVTVLLFGFVELVCEILISSCSMVTRRYFGWRGAVAGFLIGSLGALAIPAHFVVEKASHHYSERKILSKSLVFILFSTLGILNWSGLFYDVEGMISAPEEPRNATSIGGDQAVAILLNARGEFPYDYGSGPAVYIVFLSAIFMGTIVLEGVDTSIMAKCTPAKLNGNFFNSGLLATLVGTLGRVVADSMITLCALLDIHVFVDFVNATFFPILVLTLAGLYMVQKLYSKLV